MWYVANINMLKRHSPPADHNNKKNMHRKARKPVRLITISAWSGTDRATETVIVCVCIYKSQTRFNKLDDPNGPYAALVLAKAGLLRLGLGDRVTSDIVAPTLFHAVGQGALAVEIRADDAEARQLCDALTHWETSWRCLAERACLRVLEGGCSVPVGVHSKLVPVPVSSQAPEGPRAGRLRLVGAITAVDGQHHVQLELEREVSSEEQAEELGALVAKALVAVGGREILDEVAKDRERRQATGAEEQNIDVAAVGGTASSSR
jgi:hydroxymethylbilane synthase